MRDSLEQQAQGLQDWAEYQRLDALEYLDEDQAWDLWYLREALGIPHPTVEILHPRPWTYEQWQYFEQQKWMARIWADEVLFHYKSNLIMSQLVKQT